MAWVAPVVGAVASYLGSKKAGGGGTQETVPWAAQQPYLRNVFSRAEDLYGSGQLDRVAPLSPNTLSAWQAALNAAQGPVAGMTPQIMQAYQQLLGASDVANNPTLAPYIRSAIQPLEQSLLENILPQIRSGSISTGQYGGSRQGLAEGRAIEGFTRQAGNVAANITNQAYNTGLGTTQAAINQFPQFTNALLAPSTITGGIGEAERNYYQMMLNQPQNALATYQRFVGQPVGSTTTTTGPQPNRALSTLGGAIVGSQLYRNVVGQPSNVPDFSFGNNAGAINAGAAFGGAY